jgi:hypothetical protein
MKPITKQAIAIFSFLSIAVCSMAQPAMRLTTADNVFSPVALKAAVEKLGLFNKYGSTQAVLSISLFHLPAVEMRVDYREPKSDEKRKLGELIKIAEDPAATEKNNKLFLDLAAQSDKKAKGVFDKKSDKDNVLLINISLGKSYAHQRAKETEETHAYYTYSILKGDKVRGEIADDLTAILEGFKKAPKQFDFDKYYQYEQNDKNLNELMAGLFSDYSMPITLSWGDEIDGSTNGWDTNTEAFTKNHPSYLTKPVYGLPWKCISADNTFVSLKVQTGVSETGASSRLRFRLTNTEDFKLKSPTLDSKGLLWISGNAKNKETAIVPTLEGKDLDIYRANVIAYEKIQKTVSVVFVEEENDDIQLVEPGTKGLSPDTHVVEAGPNGFLDTKEKSEKDKKIYDHDDVRVCDEKNNCFFTAGPNGICDTFANNENLKPIDLGFDLNEFETQLNKIYNPYLVEWKVEKVLHRKSLNYDIDLNGYYDPDSYAMQNGSVMQWNLHEEEVIYKNARIGNSSHYLFFVKGVNNQTTELLARETKFESAIINTENIKSYAESNNLPTTQQLYETCAHELGHAALKLAHTPTIDEPNLMHASSDKGIILRKFQWDIVHGILSPEAQYSKLKK